MFAIRKLGSMKTVLVPTDFSKKSLQLIKNVVLHYPNESVKLILASGYNMSLGRFGFSNDTQPKLKRTLGNKIFYKTLASLIQEHKNKISDVSIELYTGKSNTAFINFLTTNQIDEAIIPNTNLCQFPNKKCFDLTPLIDQFSPNVSRVTYESEAEIEPTRFWFFNLKEHFSFK